MRKRRDRRLNGANRDRFIECMKVELYCDLEAGRITKKEYDTRFKFANRPRLAQRVIVRFQDEYGSVDWRKLTDWVKNNWVEILKILLSLAVLFLEDESEELWP